MTEAEKLAHYLGLEYEVRLIKKKDAYELGIPELGLRVSGEDIPAAHAKLMAAKDEWITELCAQKLYSWIVKPGGAGDASHGIVRLQAPGLKQQLTPFAVKAVVVTVLMLVASMFVGNAITTAGRGLERDLHRIPEWSDEKVEKYRMNARRIVAKLQPIMVELRPLFDAGNATLPAPEADKENR